MIYELTLEFHNEKMEVIDRELELKVKFRYKK